MPDSRHRRRDRDVPVERRGTHLARRPGKTSPALQPPLSDDREFCRRAGWKSPAAGLGSVVVLDGLGYRAGGCFEPGLRLIIPLRGPCGFVLAMRTKV